MEHHRNNHTEGGAARLALALFRKETLPRVDPGEAPRIVEGLRRAGLCSLALDLLEKNGAPEGIVALLRRERERERVNLTLLYHRLGDFADALHGAGVAFIALKGTALAPLIYESVELRPMVDVDVLIRREDWPRARDALAARGYRLPPERDATFWLANYFNMPVSSPGEPPSSFDLHWSLGQEIRFQIDDEGLWERAVRIDVEGRRLLRLSDEDLLLSLVLHLGYHYFDSRLLWLHDIGLLCRARPIDWDVAIRRARRWRMATILFSGLSYVEKVFPGAVPAGILEELRPGALHRMALSPLRSAAPERWFRGDDLRLAQLVQGLLIMDSPGQALRFVADKIGRRLRFLGARPRLR